MNLGFPPIRKWLNTMLGNNVAVTRAEADRPLIESLERRVLLSVTVAGGVLTIDNTVDGSGGGEAYVLSDTGIDGEVTVTGDNITTDQTHVGVNSIMMILGNNGNSVTIADNLTRANGSTQILAITVGNGGDTYVVGDSRNTVNAGTGDDTITGGSKNDIINGARGDDTIAGGDGNDVISGGIGSDTIMGDDGLDTINGGRGDDTLNGDDDNDTINGNDGNDTIVDTVGNNTVDAGADNDTITTGPGNDTVDGGTGTDTHTSGGGSDTIVNVETLL
jgi:Ca2+-binding RTX toxin-like protein